MEVHGSSGTTSPFFDNACKGSSKVSLSDSLWFIMQRIGCLNGDVTMSSKKCDVTDVTLKDDEDDAIVKEEVELIAPYGKDANDIEKVITVTKTSNEAISSLFFSCFHCSDVNVTQKIETPIIPVIKEQPKEVVKLQQQQQQDTHKWNFFLNKYFTPKDLKLPFEVIEINQAEFLERSSISELTMRSSHITSIKPASNNRIMAYYAIGQNHKHVTNKSNRKCYFTGKYISQGTPFYAGTLKQGYKTLVVFCLPESFGLSLDLKSRNTNTTSDTTVPIHSHSSCDEDITYSQTFSDTNSFESAADTSYNEQLLEIMPPPCHNFLKTLQFKFPELIKTLPQSLIYDAEKWSIYNTFCFFSGLPILIGELHYRLKGNRQINLSHEILEIVLGKDSASLVRLPTTAVFDYLKVNYRQQCHKICQHDRLFQRCSWELVLPEV